MTNDIIIEMPDKLIPVFSGVARYRGAYGGRGGGKSIAFADMAIATIMQKQNTPKNFLCTRELQKSLKDSVFSLLAAQIEEHDLLWAFDIGKEYLRCKNRNEFLFYGLRSNIAEIKGLHRVKWVWNEEAQKTSQSSLDYLTPTIREPDSEIWFTWNPDQEDDPVHKMLVTNKPHNARVAEINYTDNLWFPKVLEDERLLAWQGAQKVNNFSRYNWIWLGQFNINSEGAVYAKWINKDNIKSDLYDPTLKVHTAWDIGYSDYTTIWFYQAVRGEVRFIDFYENNREGPAHYCGMLAGHKFIPDSVTPEGKIIYKRGDEIPEAAHRKQYKYGKHWVPHDAVNTLYAANGRSAVEQMADLGFKAYVVAAQDEQAQITIARATLNQSYFDSIRCAEGLRQLRRYMFEFDEDKNRYKDKPCHDFSSHAADAFEVASQTWRNEVKECGTIIPQFALDQTADELFWPKKEGNKRERI